MNVKRILLLGQLLETIHCKAPNMENRCRGLINSLIALETEEPDCAKSESEKIMRLMNEAEVAKP